jgi:hypothetical protein
VASKHIFLSYAKEDSEFVRRVRARLQKVGLRPWLDEHDLLPGQDWDEAIRGAIRSSAAFVAFLSTRAVDKTGYVQKEIREALDVAERMPQGRMFIVPVRIDECVVPERLGRWQRIDIFKRGGYARLQAALLSHVHPESRMESTEVIPIPAFDTPADHMLHELLLRSGRVVYAQISERRYAVGQGHFYVFKPELPAAISSLKRHVADFRKTPASNVKGLLRGVSRWRRDENRVTRMAAAPGSATIVLQSALATTGVDPRYWTLAMTLARNPHVYIAVDNGDFIYVEDNRRVLMVIAPRRLSDEDHAVLRSP